MKTIGLIGGMSWESSLEYYRIINETVKQKLGHLHSCECIMYSVDFAEIEKLQHEEKWDVLTNKMTNFACKLETAGAELLVICTNTMHNMVPEIQKNINTPILHIADATAEEIKVNGIDKIGLLGTRFTMEQDFYRGKLQEKHNIEVTIPLKSEREVIHNVIYQELINGVIKEESRTKFKQIITNLQKRGAQGIILGCTEIPLLIKERDTDLPVFDTTLIHAKKAVEFALSL